MDNSMLGGAYIVFVLLGLVVLFLWILLPFAVFGIKQRLDRMIELLEKITTKAELRPEQGQEASKKHITGGGYFTEKGGKKKFVDKDGNEFDVG